jgi:hypothetical protein
MRDDGAIKREIVYRLGNNNLWTELRKSLLGRELLAFGASTVKSVEMLMDEFKRLGYLSEGGVQDLIAAAYLNDVSLDLYRPAYVKGLIRDKENPDRKLDGIMGPYCIEVLVDGTAFYTWRFVDVAKSNIYYQSKVRQTWNHAAMVELWDKHTAKQNHLNWVLYKEYAATRGDTTSCYIKLGIHAISDSVRVFCRFPKYGDKDTNVILPMQLYDGYNGGPSEPNYKVLPGHDGSVNVHFGDDIWGAAYNQDLFYHIYWLEKTYAEIDLETLDSDSLTSISSMQIPVDTLLQQVPLNVNNVQFEFESADNTTSAVDMVYASTYVKSKLGELRGLGSVSQVRAFCNSISGVLDSYVVADNNRLNIYIKPMNPNDAYFDNIYDWLIQRGVGGLTYTVQIGEPLFFSIKITLFGVLSGYDTTDLTTRIKQVLTERFSRTQIAFRETVSVLEIVQKIQEIAPDVRALVELTVTEDIKPINGAYKTSLLPLKNTMYREPAGSRSGWVERDGVLSETGFAYETFDFAIGTVCGDSFISKNSSGGVAYNLTTLQYRDSIGFISSGSTSSPDPSMGFALGNPNTMFRTYQSEYYTLLLSQRGEIWKMSAEVFGGRTSTLYASGSTTFTYKGYTLPGAMSLGVYYPASFANVCVTANNGKPKVLFYDMAFNLLLSEIYIETSGGNTALPDAINSTVSTGQTQGLPEVSMIQKSNKILLFSVDSAGVLYCDILTYTDGKVAYRKSVDNQIIGAPTAKITQVLVGPKFLFAGRFDPFAALGFSVYSWSFDEESWSITLTKIGEDLSTSTSEFAYLWMTHDGGAITYRLKNSPYTWYTLSTDGNTLEEKEVVATNGETSASINTYSNIPQAYIEYDTGSISVNTSATTLDGMTYQVANIALSDKSTSYPELRTIEVFKGN